MIRKTTLTICASLVIAVVAASVGGAGVSAQSRAELAARIDQIERQLRAVQRKLFSQTGEAGGQPPAVTQTEQLNSRRLLADMSVQVSNVEAQLRRLTGRLETLEHRQAGMQKTIELLRKDTALRFEEAQGAAAVTGTVSIPSPQAKSNRLEQAIEKPAPQVLPEAPPQLPEGIRLPDGAPKEQYDYAFAFIHKNDLDKGRQAMEKFIARNPSDTLVGNAKYWLGRIQLRQNRPGLAAQQLLSLIESFPEHPKMTDALVDLADALVQLDSASDACNALAEFNRVSDKASPRLKQRAGLIAKKANCN